MTATEPWIEEACAHAMEFLAVLAAETPEAQAALPAVWDALMDQLDDPAKFHTMLVTLVWIAHAMRTSANGDHEPGIWTFEVHTPLGVVPIDTAPPSIRWVSRWLIAGMNGDFGAAADLWFGTFQTKEEILDSIDTLAGPLMAFLTHSVREFVRVGRPLVLPEMAP